MLGEHVGSVPYLGDAAEALCRFDFAGSHKFAARAATAHTSGISLKNAIFGTEPKRVGL
jgi:hypothetical protein